MRRILVDTARRKRGPARGGNLQRQDVSIDELVQHDDAQQVLEVHDALDKLAEEDPAVAALVKLRYFGGLSLEETAETLGISVRTASRYWSYAKIWLHHEIGHGEDR
jgi:RNA polymerase sigma factor (TIGR02999 family)